MVSGFLTTGGRLKVADDISNSKLLGDPTWLLDSNGIPVRDAIEFLEYGMDNYWNGDKMVNHTLGTALKIFRYASPDCMELWAFENATNHNSYAHDALNASSKMNIRLEGDRQPKMRDSFDHGRGLSHSMVFPNNHPNPALRGQAKGLKISLK
jgi:hypothetical protein